MSTILSYSGTLALSATLGTVSTIVIGAYTTLISKYLTNKYFSNTYYQDSNNEIYANRKQSKLERILSFITTRSVIFPLSLISTSIALSCLGIPPATDLLISSVALILLQQLSVLYKTLCLTEVCSLVKISAEELNSKNVEPKNLLEMPKRALIYSLFSTPKTFQKPQ